MLNNRNGIDLGRLNLYIGTRRPTINPDQPQSSPRCELLEEDAHYSTRAVAANTFQDIAAPRGVKHLTNLSGTGRVIFHWTPKQFMGPGLPRC